MEIKWNKTSEGYVPLLDVRVLVKDKDNNIFVASLSDKGNLLDDHGYTVMKLSNLSEWAYIEEQKQDITETLKNKIKHLEEELKKQTRNYKDLVTAAKMISCELEYLNLD